MQVQVSLTIEIGATASLTQMEEQIQQAGQQAMRQALKQTIKQWEDQRPVCPHCGQKQRRLEGTVRRSIATTFGRVAVPRRRFRCQECGRSFCPANSLFSELKGGTISQPLQEAALLAGCSWPYRVASSLLRRLSGAQISAEEIRLLTNRGGQQRAEQQQEQAERTCSTAAREARAAQQAEQPMLVGWDGGWVCSWEQRGGMEGKVAVVCSQVEDLPMPSYSTTFSWSQRGGPRQPPRQRHRLVQRRYVATFGPAHQLGQQAKATAQALGDEPARPVVIIADGAHWIKKQQGQHFPHATCILDWAHLWREVGGAIQAAARAKGLTPRERDYQLYVHRSWLWQGGVDQAVQGLRTLGQGLAAEPLERITKAITYLENQRRWIGSYEQWRKQGYPVGSGMIERAVALVINRRMKKRGMRWKRVNGTAVVALRTDVLNDDWILPQRLRAFP
jgi:transposase-like protein